MSNGVKYGLLVASPRGKSKNVGDYIQSIAQRQFLPRVDTFIQRDEISQYTNEQKDSVALIMNAWYMWHSENWPPSILINPLPISMHLSPVGYEGLLSKQSISWFKTHEPIGCRDLDTMSILQSRGVAAYFSGCLTLTLNFSYSTVDVYNRKGVCFVDPYIPPINGKYAKLKTLCYIIVAPYSILTLYSRNLRLFSCSWNSAQPFRKRRHLKALFRICQFYKIYSQKFTAQTIRNAEYIPHMVDVNKCPTDEALFDLADQLLKKYARKKYVVTSRIHAGLPCLSMGTPVVFVEHPDVEGKLSNGKRTKGLSDFFYKMTITQSNKLSCEDIFNRVCKLDETFVFENKHVWKKYADQLATRCLNFIHSLESEE